MHKRKGKRGDIGENAGGRIRVKKAERGGAEGQRGQREGGMKRETLTILILSGVNR